MKDKTIADLTLLAANYNNGPYLGDFIESILASTVLPSQIIIVDDGSTDDSLSILKKYESHPLAFFIYLPENTGFANALNKGIMAAKGRFIMRADPDDLLLPEKIEKQFDFLGKNDSYCGLGCNVMYFNGQNGKNINKSNFPHTKEALFKAYRKGEHGMQHPTVMLKTEVIRQFLYKQEAFPAEDYEIFARMLANGYHFANLEAVLYRMRIHPESISSRINFKTIQKTFLLRYEIFGIKTSIRRQKFYYLHILNYRKYLLSQNIFCKINYLILTVFYQPAKLFKRIFQK